MKKFLLLVFLVAGCATDGQKHWYDDALKDLRGDNQQMRGFHSTAELANKAGVEP